MLFIAQTVYIQQSRMMHIQELGLYTNETKTKYMSITNKQGRLHNNSVKIGSKRFEKVKKSSFWE